MTKAERFFDIVEPGGSIFVVAAKVRLLTTEEGGLRQPFTTEYAFRPNHNFGDAENRGFYMGQFDFRGRDIVPLGKEFETKVAFVEGRGLKEMLVPGRSWRIQQGSQLIGIGEILSVEAQR